MENLRERRHDDTQSRRERGTQNTERERERDTYMSISSTAKIKIGVLALQGAFLEHVNMLRATSKNLDVSEVRVVSELKDLDGLIIPGGESTAFGIIGGEDGMFEKLKEFVKSSKPVWGTCAGLIVLADRVEGQKRGGQSLVGGLDITVKRNYFGKQVCSFEADISAPPPSVESTTDRSAKRIRSAPFPGIFIRAPAVLEIGSDVDVLASVDVKEKSTIVAVRQGNLLGTSFHPELGDDARYHKYFVEMVEKSL